MTEHDARSSGDGGPPDADGTSLREDPAATPALPAFPFRGREALQTLVGLAGMVAVFTLVGFLVTNLLVGFDESAAQWWVEQRTDAWTTVAQAFSRSADTIVIVPLALAATGLLVAATRRWREGVTLLLALSVEASTFFLVSVVVGRARPEVEIIGQQPTTSSFPSGHAAAATAVYVGLGLLLAWRIGHRAVRWAAVVVGAVAAVGVSVARLYLAMHHTTDVVAGVVVGLVAIAVAVRVVDAGVTRNQGRPHGPDGAA